jgi:hypothetical protein
MSSLSLHPLLPTSVPLSTHLGPKTPTVHLLDPHQLPPHLNPASQNHSLRFGKKKREERMDKKSKMGRDFDDMNDGKSQHDMNNSNETAKIPQNNTLHDSLQADPFRLSSNLTQTMTPDPLCDNINNQHSDTLMKQSPKAGDFALNIAELSSSHTLIMTADRAYIIVKFLTATKANLLRIPAIDLTYLRVEAPFIPGFGKNSSLLSQSQSLMDDRE